MTAGGRTRVEDLTVVIQAGGESKCMGTSKALVPFLGAPLILRGVYRLFPICNEMVITTNEPEKMGFLSAYSDTGRLKFATDGTDRRGALVGIHTAFEASTGPYVALVACDMVFPSADLLIHLRNRLDESGADVAIPRTKHGFEPFHAVYRRDTCLPVVERMLEGGEIRATSWLAEVDVLEIGHDEIREVHPRGAAFVNVNTPEELHAIERRILEEGMPSAADDLDMGE